MENDAVKTDWLLRKVVKSCNMFKLDSLLVLSALRSATTGRWCNFSKKGGKKNLYPEYNIRQAGRCNSTLWRRKCKLIRTELVI